MQKLFRTLPLFIITISAWVIATNHVALADWWFLRTYEPPAQIEVITERMNMSEKARKYFYASNPKLNDKLAFNENCPFPERTFVLGCYTSDRKIYILDVKEKELEGVEDVTAVHEMLHAAYDRLSTREKNKVNELVKNAFQGIDDERLQKTLTEYRKEDPTVLANELHSILATEVENLPHSLENYYSQYFTDGRRFTIRTFNDYKSVFADIEKKQERLSGDINSLKSEITGLKTEINSVQNQITTIRKQMNRYEDQGNIEAYNALVAEHNRLVNRYENLVSLHNTKVAMYNAKVKEYNSLTFKHRELIEAIDSKDINTNNEK